MRQNRHYQILWLMCNWVGGFWFGLDIGAHNFKFSGTDWIWSLWKNIGSNPIAKFPYPYTTRLLSRTYHSTSTEGREIISWIQRSVEQIGDFCNPNPVQNFHWVIRSNPNPVDLSNYLIQSGLYLKNLWLSIMLQWSTQFGYPYLLRLSFFEIQSNPVLNCNIRLQVMKYKDEVGHVQKKILKKQLSGFQCTFIEPNKEDIHAQWCV